MDKQREQFENFLREFEPRRPRALPEMPDAFRARRAAAGIVVAVLCAGALWIVSQTRETSTEAETVSPARSAPQREIVPTARELVQLAMEDPKEFDAALTAASRQILPRFEGTNSTLRVLAKD